MGNQTEAPILEFTSHVQGKNAKVRVFVDRVEWERGKSVSAGKITAGLMTGGLSLAATGVRTRKGAGTEVILLRSVTSVTSRRDSLLNDAVSVITSGNTIDFRVSKGEGEQITRVLLDLVAGRHPAQTQAHAPAGGSAPQYPSTPPNPATSDVGEKLQQLASLHAQGVLTDAEFAAAKSKALGL
jgi:hypothetical protein